MLSFGAQGTYDEIIDQVTDSNVVEIDWSALIAISDRIAKEPAKNIKSALIVVKKRLNNRDPHVVMHTLELLNCLWNNSGTIFRQQVSSADFVPEIKDKATSSNRVVALKTRQIIKDWADNECKKDPSLSLIASLYRELLNEGYSFQSDEPKKKVAYSDDPNVVNSAEEEAAIAKAIAESLKDAEASKSGYGSHVQIPATSYPILDSGTALPTVKALNGGAPKATVGREVKALYDFEAVEDNELSFKAGDMITVLDDSDANWWKGQSHRGVGFFPASFVSDGSAPLPGSILDDDKGLADPPVRIDKEILEKCLELLQDCDPTGEVPDPAELTWYETQSMSMVPLIEKKLAAIDKQYNMLVAADIAMRDVLAAYDQAMQQVQYQTVQPAFSPYQQHQNQPLPQISDPYGAPPLYGLPPQQQQPPSGYPYAPPPGQNAESPYGIPPQPQQLYSQASLYNNGLPNRSVLPTYPGQANAPQLPQQGPYGQVPSPHGYQNNGILPQTQQPQYQAFSPQQQQQFQPQTRFGGQEQAQQAQGQFGGLNTAFQQIPQVAPYQQQSQGHQQAPQQVYVQPTIQGYSQPPAPTPQPIPQAPVQPWPAAQPWQQQVLGHQAPAAQVGPLQTSAQQQPSAQVFPQQLQQQPAAQVAPVVQQQQQQPQVQAWATAQPIQPLQQHPTPGLDSTHSEATPSPVQPPPAPAPIAATPLPVPVPPVIQATYDAPVEPIPIQPQQIVPQPEQQEPIQPEPTPTPAPVPEQVLVQLDDLQLTDNQQPQQQQQLLPEVTASGSSIVGAAAAAAVVQPTPPNVIAQGQEPADPTVSTTSVA